MCFLILFIIGLPIGIIRFLSKRRNVLEVPEFQAKWSNLYEGIHLKRGKWNIAYVPLTMMRRTLFVAIPYLFPDKSWFQVQMLLFLTTSYLMMFLHMRPHVDRGRHRIEVFNECAVILSAYHMILFSKFSPSLEVQFGCGYSYVGVFVMMMLVNIARIISVAMANSQSKVRGLKVYQDYIADFNHRKFMKKDIQENMDRLAAV